MFYKSPKSRLLQFLEGIELDFCFLGYSITNCVIEFLWCLVWFMFVFCTNAVTFTSSLEGVYNLILRSISKSLMLFCMYPIKD